MTIYGMLLLLGAGHGIFLALAIWLTRRGDRTARHFLALLTLAFALDLLGDFAHVGGYRRAFAASYPLTAALDFLYGPLTYFYVRALIADTPFRLTPKKWLHFVPGLLALGLMLFLWLKAPLETWLQAVLVGEGELPVVLIALVDALLTLSGIVSIGLYIVLALRALHRHSRYVGQQFSYTERVRLDWLRWLLLVLSGLYLLYLFALFLSEWYGLEALASQMLNLAVVATIYVMGLLGMRQPLIFRRSRPAPEQGEDANQVAEPEAPAESAADPPGSKYRKSAVSSQQSQAILAEIRDLFSRDSLHRDNRLTLPQLAEQVGLSANYVSQAINEGAGVNFFDFVNGYRIEEARQLLTATREHIPNVLDVANQCGFNSKTAFYTAFRKHTGMTPTQYRKQSNS